MIHRRTGRWLRWPARRVGSEVAAIADLFGKIHLSGLLAWLIWAFIHIMYIVQFGSRLVVFVKWAIQDLTFNRGSRLITGEAPSDFKFDQEVARGAMEPAGRRAPAPKTEIGAG